MAEAAGPLLGEIAAASPEMLGMSMLKGDVHASKLDEGVQRVAVLDALADGAATAGQFRTRFPGLAPRAIADALAIAVTAIDDDPMVGSIWRFAEYRARPPHIVLYMRGLAPIEHALAGRRAASLIGEAAVQDVFIAHELYHHAEATRADIPVARRHQATLFQIGKWRWRTGIATLAEIAAGSFAQALLDLPCHPRVLDFVARQGVVGFRPVSELPAAYVNHAEKPPRFDT